MKKLTVIAFILAFAGVSPALWSQYATDGGAPAEFSNLTLRGIKSVAIEITGVENEYRRYGVDELAIRQGVEQQLRAANINVVSREQAIVDPTAALLQISLHANLAEQRYYSYAVSLKVRQKVALAQDPNAFISTPVWSQGTSGVLLPMELSDVNADIATLMSHFIADHQAQNRV